MVFAPDAELSFKTFAASLADATGGAKTSQVSLPELLNALGNGDRFRRG